jgi:hypothetical protein
MNRFEYTDTGKARLQLEPITERGERMVMLSAHSPEANLVVVDIPLDRVEEVIAGLRDIARQAAGRPAPCPCMCGYPNDPDTVHPTNGDPCYTTVPTVGEQRAVAALRLADGSRP